MLARLTRVEPRLALSGADALALAPLAARWIDLDVPELEARALLTDGLPSVVHSARGLLANRLTRKVPAPRAAAPTARLAECGTCRDPLPRGQSTGICAACTGVTVPRPRTATAEPATTVAERVAALRALVRTPTLT